MKDRLIRLADWSVDDPQYWIIQATLRTLSIVCFVLFACWIISAFGSK